jgi:hypothetical protein
MLDTIMQGLNSADGDIRRWANELVRDILGQVKVVELNERHVRDYVTLKDMIGRERTLDERIAASDSFAEELRK